MLRGTKVQDRETSVHSQLAALLAPSAARSSSESRPLPSSLAASPSLIRAGQPSSSAALVSSKPHTKPTDSSKQTTPGLLDDDEDLDYDFFGSFTDLFITESDLAHSNEKLNEDKSRACIINEICSGLAPFTAIPATGGKDTRNSKGWQMGFCYNHVKILGNVDSRVFVDARTRKLEFFGSLLDSDVEISLPTDRITDVHVKCMDNDLDGVAEDQWMVMFTLNETTFLQLSSTRGLSGLALTQLFRK